MATSAIYPEKTQLNLRMLTWGELTWIDIIEPTREATKYLAERYGFHPLDLEDCLSRRQISKLDTYPEYLFVIFHLTVYDKATQKSSLKQWSAFVGDKYLITLRPQEFKPVDALFRVCELNLKAREEYMGNGSGYLLYCILDRAIDSYFPVLNAIMRRVDSIEDAVFDETKEAGRAVALLRQDIITQRRLMFPTRDLFRQLEAALGRFSKINLSVYLGDLMDHVDKICDTLDKLSEVIEVFKDADFILSSYRTNRVIRVLFILFTILAPFIVLTALCSMKMYLAGSVGASSLTAFITFFMLTLVISGALLFYFRRQRLI